MRRVVNILPPCPTFGKLSAPQGAVTLNVVCSYWLQRAHYDAVISVKYTSQTGSLCHNFCVLPPSQPNCGIGVTGSEGFWEAETLQWWGDIVRKSLHGVTAGSLRYNTGSLGQLNSQLNFTPSYPPTQASLSDLVFGELVIWSCCFGLQ